jgi:HlyD family secretion protein
MKKIYLYALTAIVVLGTLGYLWLSSSASKDPRYRTDKVSRGSVIIQVRATGVINPVKTVQVGSQVSGTIAKINVDFNSEVKKGQVIAEIDPTFLQASVNEALANLEHNKAQVDGLKRTYVRTEELFKKDLVSAADDDAAKTAYEAAEAQLKQTQAALDRAKVNLLYATIRSPIDGVIISREVDVGQTVAASLQTPTLFSIGNDLTRMQVEASVDEADIGQIREGERVTFTVDAYPETQFRGSVSQVRLAPVTVQNVVTYTVVIDVPNPDLKLRPGMTATVSILIDRRDNALRIPTLALRFQPPADAVPKSAEPAATSVGQPDSGKQDASQREGVLGQGGAHRGGQGQPDSARSQGGRSGGGQWRAQGGQRGQWGNQTGEGSKDQRPARKQQVWVLDADKNLKAITVMLGLNDNRYVELTGGDLKEGDEVVIGLSAAETANSSNQQTNPFAPRGPGGPGGGGGRGR